MVGGPDAFGAGGWIGSPVADILPVDLDPPQLRQLPQGSLALVIDRSGSMSGPKLRLCKSAAIGAVRALSRLDHVGVVMFDTKAEWVVPMQPAADKDAIEQRIRQVPEGGGTDIHPALALAEQGLSGRPGVRHVILLTDGQTAGADCRPLAGRIKQAGITVSTVAVGADADVALLRTIAQVTGGRCYRVLDPAGIPQIFIKEAQVVRRSLILEQPFNPRRGAGFSELAFALGDAALPRLDGYVLTGSRGGLAQVVLRSGEGDPVLATGPAGIGRVVAFTSSADGRWASQWLAWGGFARFWEQAVRWAGEGSRSGRSADCEVFTDVQGRTVTVTVEAAESAGRVVQLADLAAQAIAPDMTARPVQFQQVGPGQYRGSFRADAGGSYLVNVGYRKEGPAGAPGAAALGRVQAVASVPFAPEFEELTDNRAVLEEVAAATGGRVLELHAGGAGGGNGSDAPPPPDLFDRRGVVFPETVRPLTRPLMILWLALFLLDVAVRRIAIDFRGLARSAWAGVATLRRRRQAQADPTLARLKERRAQVRDRLAPRPGSPGGAERRYEPPADAPDALPEASRPGEETDQRPDGEAAKPAVPPPEPGSTMDRLLQSKRQRRERK